MERSWILVGMMGVGKSAVGREIALQTSRRFLDTDQILQSRLGRPVPQIFQIYGEGAFRDHETSVLRSLEPGHAIVSTGGGIVVREGNWAELRRLGITLYLEADPEQIICRLTASKKRRPLLEVENWEDRFRSLISQREPLYRQADLTLRLDGEDIVEAAERAVHAFQEFAK